MLASAWQYPRECGIVKGVRMFGVNMFFLILSVLLVYAAFNKRVNMLVDKTLQVYEMKLDKALKEKEQK